MRGAEEVERVVTCVFPSDRIVAELEPGTFLFSEHPLDFADEPGFLPLSLETYEAMRENGISFYNAHAPLDMHPEVSPSRLCAAGRRARAPRGVLPDLRGHLGRRGRRRRLAADGRRARRRAALVPRPRDQGARAHPRRGEAGRVAMVAGGGAMVEILEAALERGCQTYVTGNAATNCRLDFVQEQVRAFRRARRRGRRDADRRDALRDGEAAAARDGRVVPRAWARGRVRAGRAEVVLVRRRRQGRLRARGRAPARARSTQRESNAEPVCCAGARSPARASSVAVDARRDQRVVDVADREDARVELELAGARPRG